MATLRSNFTSVDSFVQFYEGLRLLQDYREQHDRVLLDQAAQRFSEGARSFPQDALLVYYLATSRFTQSRLAQQTARLTGDPVAPDAGRQNAEALELFIRLRDNGPPQFRRLAKLGLLSIGVSPEDAGAVTLKPQGYMQVWKSFLSKWPTRKQMDVNAEALQLDVAAVAVQAGSKQSAKDIEQLKRTLDELDSRVQKLRLTDRARIQLRADIENTRGKLHLSQDRQEDAEAAFRLARTLRPQWLPALNGMMSALKKESAREGQTAREAPLRELADLGVECRELVMPASERRSDAPLA